MGPSVTEVVLVLPKVVCRAGEGLRKWEVAVGVGEEERGYGEPGLERGEEAVGDILGYRGGVMYPPVGALAETVWGGG